MGILTRRQGDQFVITSDRATGDPATRRARGKLVDYHQVWTGTLWSTTLADAIAFASLDSADEYVRAHFSRIIA